MVNTSLVSTDEASGGGVGSEIGSGSNSDVAGKASAAEEEEAAAAGIGTIAVAAASRKAFILAPSMAASAGSPL